MRKLSGILFIIMLLFLSTAPVALATDNHSEWDVSFQNMANDSISNGVLAILKCPEADVIA